MAQDPPREDRLTNPSDGTRRVTGPLRTSHDLHEAPGHEVRARSHCAEHRVSDSHAGSLLGTTVVRRDLAENPLQPVQGLDHERDLCCWWSV